ncbi:MAG: DUF1461 domain-containing protein [Nanoarchaeota archaeon]
MTKILVGAISYAILICLLPAMLLFLSPLFYHGQFISNGVYDSIGEANIWQFPLYFVGIGRLDRFTSAEAVHMGEVRVIVLMMGAVILVATATFAFSARNEHHATRHKNIGNALVGGGTVAIMIGAALVIAATRFETFFTMFHETMFTSAWQFPSDSLLITLFPEQTFVHALIIIIITIFAVSALSIALGMRELKRDRGSGHP